MVFNDGYEAAWDKGYRRLQPANQYNIDYSLIGLPSTPLARHQKG
jgi:glutamine synthetase